MGRFGTGQVTLEEVRDGSKDPRVGPGRVGGNSESCGLIRGPSGRPGTGRVTHEEIQDGSWDPR